MMTPTFSIIIPTLNESACIGGALAAARAAFGADAELIVSDGGSSDDTREKAHAGGAAVIGGPAGRGMQLDAGYHVSKGAICIFLHADTLLPADAATAISRALQARDVAGGAFRVRFTGAETAGRLLGVLQTSINARARLFRTATGDQAIFARRDVLARIGGVPHVPLFEDVRLCRKLKRNGKFVVLREAVTTSPRLWQRIGSVPAIGLHLGFRLLHTLGASPVFLSRFYPVVR